MFYKRHTILNIILLNITVVFLSSCSTWKNHLVSLRQQESYAYQGDTIQQWSLIRLDSMGGNWGYVSADGKRTIPPIFDWADDFTDGMALVHYQGHYSYLNPKGKRLRRIKAAHAYAFSEGLAAVQKNDKWGYIDRSGNWVIKAQFDWALPFSENRAAVAVGRHYGFIDPQGDMVVVPQYTDIKPFINGRSIVQKNGKYGLIDILGQEILSAQFRHIEPWKKGTYRLHVSDRKMGLANPDGQVILDTIYSNMTVYSEDNFIRVVNQSVGLYDFNGREILPPQYFFLGFISDKGFLVAVKDGKYGIVDTTGKTVLPFIYDDGHTSFIDGKLIVYKDDRCFLIDNTFRVIKELPYKKVYPFSNGFAVVDAQKGTNSYDSKLGYINERGEEVVRPQYDKAFGFNEHGLAIVGLRDQGITEYLVIDTAGMLRSSFLPETRSSDKLYGLGSFGHRVFYNDSGGNSLVFLSAETGRFMPEIPYTTFYTLGYSDRKDLAVVRIGSKVGLIDTTLTELLPVRHEDISTYTRNRIAVKQNGKWGFADEKFRFRIPFVYDTQRSFRYGYARVDINKQEGLIDPKGRIIIPLQYTNLTIDSISNRIYAQKEQGSDVYDLYGHLLLNSTYDDIRGFWGKNYTTFRQGEKTGILDTGFQIICEPKYDRIGPLYDGRAWVVDGNKGGFLDHNFHVAIPIEYDYIEDFSHGFTRVEKGDESFYIDIHGKQIYPSDSDITKRKEELERRHSGFVDFSS